MKRIRVKRFMNNESDETINQWLDDNVDPDDFRDIRYASVIDNAGRIRDRIVIVYEYDDDPYVETE